MAENNGKTGRVGIAGFDLESVRKGDVIEFETIAYLACCDEMDTPKYRFFLLQLQQTIQDATGFTVKIHEQYELRVLTDSEAYQHNARLQKRYVRGIHKRHKMLQNVETRNLTDSEKREHERVMVVSGYYVGALSKAKTELRSGREPRRLPKLNETIENED